MPIKVTCPKCGGVLHAPDDAGGKRGRCPTCATVLPIPAIVPAGPPPAVPGASAFRPPAGPPPGLTDAGADDPLVPPVRGTATPDGRPALTRPELPKSTGRLPPPVGFAPKDPPRLPEPPRHAEVPATADPREEAVDKKARGWRSVRRGLGLIRLAAVFAFLAPAAVAGLVGYEQYAQPLPDKTPGFLGKDTISQAQEIRAAAVGVPVLLAVLFTVLGRLAVGSAPKSSYARGTARLAGLATLLALAGLVLAVFPTGVEIADGTEPTGLMPKETQSGMFQRFGLVVGGTLAVLAELWFLVALGKMGAALRDHRLSGRSGFLLMVAGLAAVLAAVVALGYVEYQGLALQWWNTQAQPQWDKLAQHKPIARAGAAALGGLVAAFFYLRLVGAGRRAVGGWLAQNAPR